MTRDEFMIDYAEKMYAYFKQRCPAYTESDWRGWAQAMAMIAWNQRVMEMQ